MNAVQKLLTDHIDIWTAAETEKRSGRGRASNNATSVYGIKKLRELILDLAVRGKLVPQNASDEPANELLKRIQNEKSILVAEGKVKTEKALSPIAEDQKYFELPLGWEWAKLGDVAYSQAGFAFKSNGFNETGMGLPLIRIRDVGQTFTGTYFDGEYREEFLVLEGDYLISMDGEFRVSKWLNGTALLNQRVSRLIFHGTETAKRFVVEALQKELRGLQGKKSYTTVDHLSGGQISNSVIALPPLNEQHRIVAKIDELMALCDQLEAQYSDAADAHEQLVSHLLGTLTQSQSAADFNANWQRIAAHFDTLFTTETSIDALKQTLLQLAVMGKLVAQDASDEPASELIKRMRESRTKWLLDNSANSECRTMTKKLAALSKAKPPFPIPDSWSTTHLIDCSRLLVDCHNKTAPYVSSGIPIIRTSNIRDRKFRLNDLRFVSEETYNFWSKRCPPEAMDIMFTREAPMGEAAIIPTGEKYCLGQRSMLIRPMHDFIYNEYLLLTLTEPHLLERSSESAIGSTVKHLRVGDVEELNIPLPPINEQHRIVAKVNELMALCDQVRSRITAADQHKKKLAEALVEQAVET
jgi:type I restriction enzyme S subunit